MYPRVLIAAVVLTASMDCPGCNVVLQRMQLPRGTLDVNDLDTSMLLWLIGSRQALTTLVPGNEATS